MCGVVLVGQWWLCRVSNCRSWVMVCLIGCTIWRWIAGCPVGLGVVTWVKFVLGKSWDGIMIDSICFNMLFFENFWTCFHVKDWSVWVYARKKVWFSSNIYLLTSIFLASTWRTWHHRYAYGDMELPMEIFQDPDMKEIWQLTNIIISAWDYFVLIEVHGIYWLSL